MLFYCALEIYNSLWHLHVVSLKAEDAQWWGHNHGFISGGFLGTKSHATKSCLQKDSRSLASNKRNTFAEEDQENLYKLVQVRTGIFCHLVF